MAMGSYHGKGNNGGGHREKGRPYGVMLLLAFAAALLGVMALHKLRERRIHNLVLRDKDRELFSLHLLLQVFLKCKSIYRSFLCAVAWHLNDSEDCKSRKLPFSCPLFKPKQRNFPKERF